MVRLEGWKLGSTVVVNIAFQFHYGSIGRQAEELLRQDIRHFNSTMVRLEDYYHLSP